MKSKMLTRKPSPTTLMKATVQKFSSLTLTPAQIQAAEMIAQKRGKSPSYEEISAATGMSSRTLHRLRTENREFQEYIKQRSISELVCQLPELTEKLYNKCLETGSARHLMLAFQLAGMLQNQIIVTPAVLERPSNEELEDSIRQLQEEIAEYETWQKPKEDDHSEEA